MDYEQIKEIAKRNGLRVTDLIALAPANDPFYVGTDGAVTDGRWFAGLFRRFGAGRGIHLRRIHYQVISQATPVLMPNGERYENTEACWKFLTLASKRARYLHLVDVEDFDDRRNPDPTDYDQPVETDPAIDVYKSDWFEAQLPSMPATPGYLLNGFDAGQRYHLEIWCFPPETEVQTIEGPKPIGEIMPGDLVLTHKGRYRPVLNTMRRPYSGELVTVRAKKSDRAIRMTPNHRVMVMGLRGEERWLRADELTTDDYVGLPRIIATDAPLPAITPDTRPNQRADGRGGAAARPVPTVEIEPKVAWVLGMFVGNGHATDKSLVFTLNAKDTTEAERLMAVARNFGLEAKRSVKENTAKVSYHSTRLVPWFKAQFGGESEGRSHTGSRHKRIPGWLLTAPDEIAKAFVEGLYDSDGHETSPGRRSISTSSPNVAQALRLLLVRQGAMPTFFRAKDGCWVTDWSPKVWVGVVGDDHTYRPVAEIGRESYTGDVCNIEVEGDNSYVTDFICHNCEKSTMNDILEPIAQEYGATLQIGVGELSITRSLRLAQRIAEKGKPARIFYISDFDPAGKSMPVAVARKLEYFAHDLGLDLDAQLYPLVLTEDQCRDYRLPRTPIKDTEKRGAAFESRFGAGATELDALQALYPGELERIVRGALDDFYDHELARRVRRARNELYEAMEAARQEVLERHVEAIGEVEGAYQTLTEEFRERLAAWDEGRKALWSDIADELADAQPELDSYPVPEPEWSSKYGDDALYNSERDYVTQIGAYKVFQGKGSFAEAS